MLTTGVPFLKKLSVLLAIMLCSVMILALPVVSYAAPSENETSLLAADVSDDVRFTFTAGEVTSGSPEAVLQIDKTAFRSVFLYLLQHIYPENFLSPAIPAFYTFSVKECSLTSILTKGP